MRMFKTLRSARQRNSNSRNCLFMLSLSLFFVCVISACSAKKADPDKGGSAGDNGNKQAATASDDGLPQSVSGDRRKQVETGGGAANPSSGSIDGGNVGFSNLSRQQLIERSKEQLNQNEVDAAMTSLKFLLLRDPDDVEVLFRLAGLLATQRSYEAAIELLNGIPEDHPDAGLAAMGQKADWLVELQKCDQAEACYRRVLKRVPDAAIGHRQLVRLLNQQGRRHEAAIHVRELCRIGDVRQEELQSLIVVGDFMESDLPALDSSIPTHQPWIASSRARKFFTEKRYEDATSSLRPYLERGEGQTAAWALYGLAAAESQNETNVRWWIKTISNSTELIERLEAFSEYWSALGVILADQRRPEPAIAALLRALAIDETDFRAMNRIIRMFELLGDSDSTNFWEKRWRESREMLRDSNAIAKAVQPDVDRMQSLSSRLMRNNRRLEAAIWGYLSDFHRSASPEKLASWNLERQRCISEADGFPSRDVLLGGVSLADYPKLNLGQIVISDDSLAVDDHFSSRTSQTFDSIDPAFFNVAGAVGLQHAFQVSATEQSAGFLMHQQLGGGVVVLDFDQDGMPDLFFAQGGWNGAVEVNGEPDHLYRNLDGDFALLSTTQTDLFPHHTIACTAGDWNQDGFPDLVTAGLGHHYLMINNGDGTYARQPLSGVSHGKLDPAKRLPASSAIADLNRDGLPDIYQVYYLEDPNMFQEPPTNQNGEVIEALGPKGFGKSQDEVAVNDGSGGRDWMLVGDREIANKAGLGVVVGNIDGTSGNEILVGNDGSANQFWEYQVDQPSFVDTALLKGLAFSSGGAGTASMGIAAADFDRNGMLDFHVANFQGEPVCLYLNGKGVFRDRAKQFGLGPVSHSVLGFGSQAIDCDNNGLVDLVVTNGHVDDYLQMDGDFRQLPQFFINRGQNFELSDVQDGSSYWSTGHLGRAMAMLDYNRDGQLDLVITHLGENSALLENQTGGSYHWVQFSLVGTSTERDAIGAKVSVKVNDVWHHAWVLAGDGYLCRNESVVSIGLGAEKLIEEVVVDWPSDHSQTFRDLKSDHRYQIVEGQMVPYQLW